MEKQILDDDLIVKERDPEKKWLTLIILGIGLILSGLFGPFDMFVFTLSVISFIISLLLFLKNTRLGHIGIALMLFGQFVGLLSFFPFSITITVFRLDLFALFLGIIFFVRNGDLIEKNRLEREGENVVEKEKKFNSKKDSFKRRFRDRSKEELNQIIANQNLVPEARAAAEELLDGI